MKKSNKDYFILYYLLSLTMLFLSLFLVKKIDEVKKENLKSVNTEVSFDISTIKKESINEENDSYIIKVDYPKFTSNKFNQTIEEFIVPYINDFKVRTNSTEIKDSLSISYEVVSKDYYLNIIFNINDSTNLKYQYKTMIFNTSNMKITNIYEIYDSILLKEKINELIQIKYSKYISDKVLSYGLNSFEYKLTDEGVIIYFNRNMFEFEISYIPYLYVSDNYEEILEERVVDTTKPMVALTFDDGPNENAITVVNTLKANASKGTFFMLGNRMKYSPDIVKYVFDNGMLIGSHSYSHPNLTNISRAKVESEINNTKNVFREITGSEITLLRSPYGLSNKNVKELAGTPIIHWSIDTLDWLTRDPLKTYESVIPSVTDGDFVLMHDIHEPTAEAVKMLVPELKARGFEVVTINEMAEYKGITLESGAIYKSLKEM